MDLKMNPRPADVLQWSVRAVPNRLVEFAYSLETVIFSSGQEGEAWSLAVYSSGTSCGQSRPGNHIEFARASTKAPTCDGH